MIDVHPPHEATHTWKDFFIHIATIVVGLLIAIGLEQTVENIHHRREVAESRKALQAEFEENLLVYRVNLASTRFIRQEMIDNLAVLMYLKQHPGTPEEQLPGTLNWTEWAEYFSDAAWTTAQQSSVTALMPRDEVTHWNNSYSRLRGVSDDEEQLWRAVTAASRFSYADPDPSHLSPAQLDLEIQLTETCIETNFRWLIAMHDLNATADQRFTPAPTAEDTQRDIGFTRSADALQKIADAQKRSDARQKPYWEAVEAATRVFREHGNATHE